MVPSRFVAVLSNTYFILEIQAVGKQHRTFGGCVILQLWPCGFRLGDVAVAAHTRATKIWPKRGTCLCVCMEIEGCFR